MCERVPSMREEDFEEYIKNPKMFSCVKSNLFKSFVCSLVEAHIGKESTEIFSGFFRENVSSLLLYNPPSRLSPARRLTYKKVVDNVYKII